MGGSQAKSVEELPPPVEGATLWRYQPANGAPIGIRRVPDVEAEIVEDAVIDAGTVFWVVEERPGDRGVLYLRLPDEQGWLFDRKPDVGIMCVRHRSVRQSIQEALERARARSCTAAVAARYHTLPKRLDADYREQRRTVLGTGVNGNVCLGTSRHTGSPVAIKHLDLSTASAQERSAMITEVEIMLSLDHPHIARLLDVYETEDRLSLVMERLSGGELFDHLLQKGQFAERDAAETLRQILCAMRYMHGMGVAHRDLKLENVLYDSKECNFLKLIDFGAGKFCDGPEGIMMEDVGTLEYLAPEVVSRSDSCFLRCDIWSAGVIAYALLSGEMPFRRASEKETLQDIRTATFSLSSGVWPRISQDGLSFVRGLLQLRPEDRPMAAEALEHPWLAAPRPSAPLRGPPQPGLVGASTAAAFVNFAALPPSGRACLRLAAFSLCATAVADARSAFLRLDPAGHGLVTITALRAALEASLPPEDCDQVCETLSLSPLCTEAPSGEVALRYSDFLSAGCVAEAGDVTEEFLRDTFRRFNCGAGCVTLEGVQSVLADAAPGEVEETMEGLSQCRRGTEVAVDVLVARHRRDAARDVHIDVPEATCAARDVHIDVPEATCCTVHVQDDEDEAGSSCMRGAVYIGTERVTARTRRRRRACYVVENRWRLVFMLPFVFSLAATSNLTSIQ